MAKGSDITKILARNDAMYAAKATEEKPGDFRPLNRFMRRYKRHYVIDADTGERVDLIMSREELDRSKEQMNTAMRDEIEKRYAEDMAET
jgi:cytidylate kinase